MDTQKKLATEKIGKLIFSLSLPAIVSQLINLLYNIVDRMYIGHIPETGSLALTGLGVCLPVILLISAFAALVSMGGAPRASIFMGKKDIPTAEKILGNCFLMLIITAVILTVVFELIAEPMLMFFGASGNTLPFALVYMRIYCFGTIFVQLTLGMNAFISAQGFAKISMLTVLIGAVLNIALDPLFIFVFNLGPAGAALATIISQAVSAIWTVKFLTGRKTALKLKRTNIRPEKAIILPCIGLGLAPFIMQSTESLISICFNSSLLKYGGDLAVGAMTILVSMAQFINLPISGLAQGTQPIISFNYGAGNKERVQKAFRLLLLSCLLFTFIFTGLIQLFPEFFISIFNNDPELIGFTVPALRLYLAAFGFFGIQMACQQTFVALGNMKCSIFVACFRKIILLIPLIYILPCFFADKTRAVFMAEPISDSLSITVCAILFAFQFKKVMKEMTK